MNRDEAEQSVPILTDAEIVGGHVVLGFSDGMTVVFRGATIRELLPYAELLRNERTAAAVTEELLE